MSPCQLLWLLQGIAYGGDQSPAAAAHPHRHTPSAAASESGSVGDHFSDTLSLKSEVYGGLGHESTTSSVVAEASAVESLQDGDSVDGSIRGQEVGASGLAHLGRTAVAKCI